MIITISMPNILLMLNKAVNILLLKMTRGPRQFFFFLTFELARFEFDFEVTIISYNVE
jgi:hypothetical protein